MRSITVAVAALMVAMAAAPLVAAHGENTVHLTIEARESECTGTRDFCFVVTSGDLSTIGTDTQVVEISFRNQGTMAHELWVTTMDKMDPTNSDTDTSTALDGTQQGVGPGEVADLSLNLPDGIAGIYLWCDVGNHESRGMWILVEFPDAGGDSPAPSAALGLVSLLVAAAWVAARRS